MGFAHTHIGDFLEKSPMNPKTFIELVHERFAPYPSIGCGITLFRDVFVKYIQIHVYIYMYITNLKKFVFVL